MCVLSLYARIVVVVGWCPTCIPTIPRACNLFYCSGGGKYNLAKLFHHELVGDVPKEDLKDFISHLSVGETTRRSPGLVRWHERINDEARFNESFRLCEFCTGLRVFFLYLRTRLKSERGGRLASQPDDEGATIMSSLLVYATLQMAVL
jgi:hypothetical protein